MRRDALVLLLGLVLAALSLVLDGYWTGLLTQALIFGGFALGLDILVGHAGLPSLGHGAFFGLAGYGTAISITRWDINPWLAAGIGIAVSVGVAAAFAPLAVRVRGLAFLTVTLAFGQVAWGLATRGGTFTGGENGIPGVRRPAFIWDLSTPTGFYLFTLIWVVLVTLLVVRFAASPVGMSLLGVRDSDRRMAALGYNVGARRAVAFGVAAGVGAVFGTLSVFFNSFVGPGSLEWRQSAQMLLAVVIGGAGSLWGPFVAGAALHVVQTHLTGATERWPLVLGALYVFTVVLLPGGIASLPRLLMRRRPVRLGPRKSPDAPLAPKP